MKRYLEGRNSSIFYIARWNDKGKPRQPCIVFKHFCESNRANPEFVTETSAVYHLHPLMMCIQRLVGYSMNCIKCLDCHALNEV
jgi:hypothetical protein